MKEYHISNVLFEWKVRLLVIVMLDRSMYLASLLEIPRHIARGENQTLITKMEGEQPLFFS